MKGYFEKLQVGGKSLKDLGSNLATQIATGAAQAQTKLALAQKSLTSGASEHHQHGTLIRRFTFLIYMFGQYGNT